MLSNVFITLFLTFACYNLVPKPIDEFNYPILFVLSFLQAIFSIKYFNLGFTKTFISTLLVTILIDCSTIYTGNLLIPLRFPFATIFPILGFLTAIVYISKSRKYFVLIMAFSSIFTFFSYFNFVPRIILQMQSSVQLQPDINFLSGTFLTIDSTELNFQTIKKENKSFYLFDLFFVDCPPCVQKFALLDSISKKYSNLKIICICNGAISSFTDFKILVDGNKKNDIVFLYDHKYLIKNYLKNVNSYPMEFILNNKDQVVSTLAGFNIKRKEDYLKNYSNIFNNDK